MSSAQEERPQLEEGKVRVTGVLIDPLLSRVVDVSAVHLVDETVRTLAGNLLTSDVPFPDTITPEDVVLQVLISELALLSIQHLLISSPGANNPKATDTFRTITPSPSPEYVVMLAIKDWSYSRQLMRNKENVVDVVDGPVKAMADLQINDSSKSELLSLLPLNLCFIALSIQVYQALIR